MILNFARFPLGTFLSFLRTVSNLLELSSEPPRVFSNLLEPSRTFSNISHLCVRLDLLDLKENLAENDEPWRRPAFLLEMSSYRHSGLLEMHRLSKDVWLEAWFSGQDAFKTYLA